MGWATEEERGKCNGRRRTSYKKGEKKILLELRSNNSLAKTRRRELPRSGRKMIGQISSGAGQEKKKKIGW